MLLGSSPFLYIGSTGNGVTFLEANSIAAGLDMRASDAEMRST